MCMCVHQLQNLTFFNTGSYNINECFFYDTGHTFTNPPTWCTNLNVISVMLFILEDEGKRATPTSLMSVDIAGAYRSQ